MTIKDFNETFSDELRDPSYVSAYLQATLEDGCLPSALQQVVKATKE